MSNTVDSEQKYVSILYDRLDQLREHAGGRLTDALITPSDNDQALSQRDAESAMYADQIAQYNAVENGLCFGRLDFVDGITRYVGRIGIRDETGDYEPLLLDWRAPGSRPFYLATVASPEGVARRRHIQSVGRTVVGVDDEALDASAAAGGSTGDLASESALLAALSAGRTGVMGDIVQTIQAEQDEIIRADRPGVLVVEGGPGTGKTAVALHRAAYLLYHHRDTLAGRAVLIVGPNTTFLRYIGRVLPGLGETAIVLSTIGNLFPGVRATLTEPDATAGIKGRPEMAGVIAAAVADRQRVVDEPWEIDFERDVVTIDRDMCVRARDRARASRLPHNAARPIFVRLMMAALARQVADRVGADAFGGPNLLTDADIAVIDGELMASTAVRAALDFLWPDLTAERLVGELFTDGYLLAAATPDRSDADRALLRRTRGRPPCDDPADGPWSVADVPLLDEAAELLGVDDSADQERADAAVVRGRSYAEGVLDILSRDIEDDEEILMAYDLIDADRLAGRQAEGDGLTVAERAAADRQWAYGHVIVDEAQELSAMAWRMLMRRSPSRSMTLVGDVAQTSEAAGTSSWDTALSPYVANRWRLDRLTVNYRTPAEIMAVAETVLRAIDPGIEAPRSIRSVGETPWRREVDQLDGAVREAVDAEVARLGDGRLAVLVPLEHLAAVRAALPEAAAGEGADLTSPVVVLTVRQAKGLEFDTVLIVEPGLILDASARGANDLYVALTRATTRLGILHRGEVPAVLAGVAVG